MYIVSRTSGLGETEGVPQSSRNNLVLVVVAHVVGIYAALHSCHFAAAFNAHAHVPCMPLRCFFLAGPRRVF